LRTGHCATPVTIKSQSTVHVDVYCVFH
jgi:hypothetical protein